MWVTVYVLEPMLYASISWRLASNQMIMKTVSQRVSKEIEYLGALAEMYEHDNNQGAMEATQSAIAALTRLVEIIDHPQNETSDSLLEAA